MHTSQMLKLSVLILFMMSSSFTQLKKRRVIFFGDSITEMGAQPGGYISKMKELIAAESLSSSYELIGSGIGGNKVYDLYLRLEEDVLSKNPDIVFIYIGINDIWHKRGPGTGTDADKFEKFYKAIIKKLQERNIVIVLCTPAVIGEYTDSSNEQDGELNQYSAIIRNLAATSKLPIVDLRNSFLNYYKTNNMDNKEKDILTTDRVHLNEKGNELVATEMLNVLRTL